MKLIYAFIFACNSEDNFVPPEKRFDFNKMNRKITEDPDNPGLGVLNYKLQTLEQSAIEEKQEREKIRMASPSELKVIHAQHLADFDMGQDLRLLDNSQDLQNLQIIVKSHRCDACRIVAMKLGFEFWNLEERFSRHTRMLNEEVVYDGLEIFCQMGKWENVGITQTVKWNTTSNDYQKDEWRLTAQEFETWDHRGEVTATSQLWPSRFAKACSELIEDYDEWELYEHWKKITKDSANPRVSNLDDLLCFSTKNSDCNRFRNPSTVKQEPILPEILVEYEKFKDEVNVLRKKDRASERKKLLMEQKRIMGLAVEREKEKQKEMQKEVQKDIEKMQETIMGMGGEMLNKAQKEAEKAAKTEL